MLAGDCVLSARQRGGKILLFAISPLLQIQLNRAAKFKSEFAKRLRNRLRWLQRMVAYRL